MDTGRLLSTYSDRLLDLGICHRTVSFYVADFSVFIQYCHVHELPLTQVTDQKLREFFIWREQHTATRSMLQRYYNALKKARMFAMLPKHVTFFDRPLADVPVLRALLREITVVPENRLRHYAIAHVYCAGIHMRHIRLLTWSALNLHNGTVQMGKKTLFLLQSASDLMKQYRDRHSERHSHQYLFYTPTSVDQPRLLTPQAVWRYVRSVYPNPPEHNKHVDIFISSLKKQHLQDESLATIYHGAHPRSD